MTELLTAAQMRAIEAAAIESGEVTGLELMERAGRGVVDAVFEEWPELAKAPHRAVVLCGPGNNGGDGFVVARLLKEWGWEVEVYLYGDPDKLPPDARVNHERWTELGRLEIFPFPDLPEETAWNVVERIETGGSAVVFDALFGTGLRRPVTIGVQCLFQAIDMTLRSSFMGTFRRVAIDIASGHCADSGLRLDSNESRSLDYNAFDAELTVSFHTMKTGHLLEECPDYCGKVVVKSIGIGGSDRRREAIDQDTAMPANDLVRLVGCDFSRELEKSAFTHKYINGHAFVLSGGLGRTGAARLAARGALRIGAGVVTLGVPSAAQMEVAGHITALMLRRVNDGEALATVLEDERINALCLGPGLGVDDRGRALVAAALGGVKPHPTVGRAVVLDADALTLMAQDKALLRLLHERCVLTPHAGEFSRLFPDIAEKLNTPATKGPAYSKVDATREAARRAGCVVLFKGPDTVIAAPDGRCSINSAQYERAAPWLATAGSGDVLAGFITGLLARGFQPMQAAETAAWLHVECARSFGPGLIAEDLPEELPKVFRGLGL